MDGPGPGQRRDGTCEAGMGRLGQRSGEPSGGGASSGVCCPCATTQKVFASKTSAGVLVSASPLRIKKVIPRGDLDWVAADLGGSSFSTGAQLCENWG